MRSFTLFAIIGGKKLGQGSLRHSTIKFKTLAAKRFVFGLYHRSPGLEVGDPFPLWTLH
jgi:hypothetical protein